MTKSGKSTVSFTLLGKIYRFFDEIRRMKDRLSGPEFLSLKAASCLSKTAQTWREKPAKPLRLGVFSGKSFRHGEKIRRTPVRSRLAPRANRAASGSPARDPGSHRPPGEKPGPLSAFPHKKPGIHTKWIPGRNHSQPVSHAQLTCNLTG